MPSRGVRPSLSCILSKWMNISSKFFSTVRQPHILVFPYQTPRRYSYGDPLTRASNAGKVDENRDFRPISGFIACCQRYNCQAIYTAALDRSCSPAQSSPRCTKCNSGQYTNFMLLYAALYTVFRQKKHSLLFSCITVRKCNQFEWKFHTK